MRSTTAILLIAVVVAVLLPVSVVFGSGPPHQPYETQTPDYAITHEFTDAFDETRERMEMNNTTPTPVADLSSDTQRAFGEMNAQSPDSQGWQSVDITVCDDRMLVCDAYVEAPAFDPTSEEHPHMGETRQYALLEHEDDHYIVQLTQHHAGPLDIVPFFESVMTLFVFALYGAFVAGFAYRQADSHPFLAVTAIGCGLVLIAWPYLVMYSGLAVNPAWPAVGLLFVGVLWWALLETGLQGDRNY